MEPLTEDEKGLVACAIRHPDFPPKPEYLPACERLVDRGWLDRTLTEDHVIFWLSSAGATAFELDGALSEAAASVN